MESIDFNIPIPEKINLISLFLNLTFCICTSFILRFVYVRKSIALSGKFHISTVIPILAIITFLVIMVVKSSLALSLGLVGALSVIRFRTPIKEPEELVYLFFAIALGLGFGSGQTLVTTLVFIITIILIWVWLSRNNMILESEFNIIIEWSENTLTLNKIIETIKPFVTELELKKYIDAPFEKSMFIKANIENISNIEDLTKSITSLSKDVSCLINEARPLQ